MDQAERLQAQNGGDIEVFERDHQDDLGHNDGDQQD